MPSVRNLVRSVAAGPNVLAALPSCVASDTPARGAAALRRQIALAGEPSRELRATSERVVGTHPAEASRLESEALYRELNPRLSTLNSVYLPPRPERAAELRDGSVSLRLRTQLPKHLVERESGFPVGRAHRSNLSIVRSCDRGPSTLGSFLERDPSQPTGLRTASVPVDVYHLVSIRRPFRIHAGHAGKNSDPVQELPRYRDERPSFAARYQR